MSIPVIEGLAAAREHISRLRREQDADPPPAVARRLREVFGRDISPEEAVARIVDDVRLRGDPALDDYALRIEGVRPASLAVDPGALEAAYRALAPGLRDALHLAADRIRAFHQQEPRQSWLAWDEEGGALGQTLRPLDRVGVYVPGGTAAYPSSLLMSAIPAQVAGVGEIVVATPPGPRGTGLEAILAAARVAGLDRVFLVGGAQAVAALAYGTQTVPKVDKITGPGNAYVASAKKHVFGTVGIDMIAGPSEILVLADGSTPPDWVAMDLFSQAEHDELAQAILLSPDAAYIDAVQREIDRLLAALDNTTLTRDAAALPVGDPLYAFAGQALLNRGLPLPRPFDRGEQWRFDLNDRPAADRRG